MEPENSFDRLARRDAELNRLAARGRRRSLRILVLWMLPVPFVLMLINHDGSVSGLIPVAGVLIGAVWYSWYKWQRRPEDTQSVAFMGLDRRTRWSAYRSMWRGSRIDDPVVLTMFESIYEHLRRSFAMMAATMCAVAVMGVALVQFGGDGLHAGWVSIGIIVLLGWAIGQQRWIIKRVGVVIDLSRVPYN